jgi:(1->4)-alpha-D-glucan 1-alpha-D-glucosylmutase
VDHPDGLANPAEYLSRLDVERVWVEKILDPGERLRHWPVSGTVGYEFLNDVAALFVDPSGGAPLTSLWHEVSGDSRQFGEWAYEAKLEQASGVFAPDVERLGRELGDDVDVAALTRAVSSLPVYRTYVDVASGAVDEQDREAIRAAGMEPWIERLLLLEDSGPAGFVTRFQQTTPAVMAKGVEDTAFYRYARLLTLNEVGGDPSRFGVSVERFHEANLERAERFPLNLLTTQTHDAKRSGDVRARIGALASMPDEWREHVQRWLSLDVPDPVEAYVVVQTLVGAWPIEVERVEAYMEKALREAKLNSNWAEPNLEHEEAVKSFVRGLYSNRSFLDDFEPFVARVAAVGERAALGQLVLKLTAPGVPDIYQGDELAFRALVDPDNRRPVDFDRRRSLLASLEGGALLGADTRKLWLTWRLLQLRAERPAAFARGSYEPYDAGENVCAYVRGGEVLVAVAVRAGAELPKPHGAWSDLLRWEEQGVAVLVR